MVMMIMNPEETFNPVYEALKWEIENFDSYYDVEELVKHFLRCSATNAWGFFDFEEALDTVRGPIEDKLNQHGLLEFDEFVDCERGNYSQRDIEMLENMFGLQTDYVYLSGEEIFEHLMHLKYDKLREEFENYGAFEDLQEIIDEIDNIDSYEPCLKIIALFDKCIHAEHVTGDIFEEIDIDDLKYEIDEEIKAGLE